LSPQCAAVFADSLSCQLQPSSQACFDYLIVLKQFPVASGSQQVAFAGPSPGAWRTCPIQPGPALKHDPSLWF
jgi:hypothetical protein